jgi:DNA-binding transcriptional ArsR family regulator
MDFFNNLCKRLANRERLNLLRKVMSTPLQEGLTVSSLADMTWLKPATARLHLHVLEDECGLVESVHEDRYVTYRTRRNVQDPDLQRLVPALVKFFREEGHGGCDVNGLKAPDPAFAKLLPVLSDENRVRVLFEIRKVGQISRAELLTLCGLAESELRHHLQALTKTGLVIKNGDSISFVESPDSLSQLFILIAFAHVATAGQSLPTDLCVSAEP